MDLKFVLKYNLRYKWKYGFNCIFELKLRFSHVQIQTQSQVKFKCLV